MSVDILWFYERNLTYYILKKDLKTVLLINTKATKKKKKYIESFDWVFIFLKDAMSLVKNIFYSNRQPNFDISYSASLR